MYYEHSTDKEVRDVIETALDNGISIIHVPSRSYLVGIHLIDPTLAELENAIDRAIKESFETIYIHVK